MVLVANLWGVLKEKNPCGIGALGQLANFMVIFKESITSNVSSEVRPEMPAAQGGVYESMAKRVPVFQSFV
jgi:hypothetical protein